MHKCTQRVAAVLVAAAVAGPVATAPGQSVERSRRLAETLRQYGMTELLEQLVGAATDAGDPASKLLLVEARLAKAAKLGDADARAAEINAAAKLLRAVLVEREKAAEAERAKELNQKETSGDAQLSYFKLKLKLAHALGILRVEPYANPVLFLYGTAEDRKALGAYAGEAMPVILKLQREATDTVRRWRQDPLKVVTVLPELEPLHEKIEWTGAWMQFYYALGAPADAETRVKRRRILRQALAMARKFTEPKYGVEPRAQLLMGRAHRELEEHRLALDRLQRVTGENVPGGARIEALFEVARTQADHALGLHEDTKTDEASAAFDKALEFAEAFQATGRKIAGQQGKLGVDFKHLLLTMYILENRAEVAPAEKAQQYRDRSEKTLVNFLKEYPDPAVMEAIGEVIAARYADREDYENFPAPVLLPIGIGAARDGDLPRAIEIFSTILEPEEGKEMDPEIARHIRPLALWHRASAYITQRRNARAITDFTALANEYPEHRLAYLGAHNAVNAMLQVVDERRAAGKPIAASLRLQLLNALDALYKHPKSAGDKEVLPLRVEEVWHAYRLAEETSDATEQDRQRRWELLKRAAAAVEQIPPDLANAQQAKYIALRARSALLREGGYGENPRDEALSLYKDLIRFAGMAKSQAEKLREAGKTEQATTLRNWGADAAFNAAVVLYEQLGDQRRALERLANLPEQWPGTTVLELSREFEISKLVEQGDAESLEKAIELVRSFGKAHGERAQKLLSLVVNKIRERIRSLAEKVAQPVHTRQQELELAKYRKVYMDFAQRLYDASKGEASPEQLYALKKMLGDAMLQNDRPAEALKLFKETRDFEQARLDRIREQIDKETARKIEAAKQQAGNQKALERLAKGLIDQRQAIGLRAMTASAAMKHWLEVARESKKPAQIEEALTKAKDALIKTYRDTAEQRKDALVMEFENVYGLARAYRALKDKAKTLEHYRAIKSRINPAENPKLYWRMELEYVQAAREVFQGEPESLKNIRQYIKVLRSRDPKMGGLAAKFAAVETQIQRDRGV